MTISPDQVYRSCQPAFVVDGKNVHRRIKITHYPILTHGLYGYGKVRIVTLTDDDREIRPRAIEVSELHQTRFHEDGEERRTGYYLVTDE